MRRWFVYDAWLERFLGEIRASDAYNAEGLARERWPQTTKFRIVYGT